MTSRLAALMLPVALVLGVAACGSEGGGSDSQVDAIVTQYERLDVTDQEIDEFRQMIDDALDILPASEHDEYLDTLLESTKSQADIVEGETPTEGGGM